MLQPLRQPVSVLAQQLWLALQLQQPALHASPCFQVHTVTPAAKLHHGHPALQSTALSWLMHAGKVICLRCQVVSQASRFVPGLMQPHATELSP